MAIVKKFRIISHKKKDPFLSLENISFSFNQNHQILDNISLNIPKGQILGLLGPNGTGKSVRVAVFVKADRAEEAKAAEEAATAKYADDEFEVEEDF